MLITALFLNTLLEIVFLKNDFLQCWKFFLFLVDLAISTATNEKKFVRSFKNSKVCQNRKYWKVDLLFFRLPRPEVWWLTGVTAPSSTTWIDTFWRQTADRLPNRSWLWSWKLSRKKRTIRNVVQCEESRWCFRFSPRKLSCAFLLSYICVLKK